MTQIAIGCDHGGINLKPVLIDYLEKKGIEYKDYGTYSEASIDYPDCAKPVCKAYYSSVICVSQEVRPDCIVWGILYSQAFFVAKIIHTGESRETCIKN